jgi:integrase
MVDMSKQLTATLKLHLADRDDPTAWVFPGRGPDAPMNPITFLGRWTTLRDQLGHASIKITVDTYGHLVPGANKAAVDRLDELTGRNLYATGMKRQLTTQPRKEP